jgi:hypothetical protein
LEKLIKFPSQEEGTIKHIRYVMENSQWIFDSEKEQKFVNDGVISFLCRLLKEEIDPISFIVELSENISPKAQKLISEQAREAFIQSTKRILMVAAVEFVRLQMELYRYRSTDC